MNRISSQGVIPNTLSHNMYTHKGLQWAILNATHGIVFIHKRGPCIRNPSLDTILLTQPGNKVAYLNKCCEQKHGKTAPTK